MSDKGTRYEALGKHERPGPSSTQIGADLARTHRQSRRRDEDVEDSSTRRRVRVLRRKALCALVSSVSHLSVAC